MTFFIFVGKINIFCLQNCSSRILTFFPFNG